MLNAMVMAQRTGEHRGHPLVVARRGVGVLRICLGFALLIIMQLAHTFSIYRNIFSKLSLTPYYNAFTGFVHENVYMLYENFLAVTCSSFHYGFICKSIVVNEQIPGFLKFRGRS